MNMNEKKENNPTSDSLFALLLEVADIYGFCADDFELDDDGTLKNEYGTVMARLNYRVVDGKFHFDSLNFV